MGSSLPWLNGASILENINSGEYLITNIVVGFTGKLPQGNRQPSGIEFRFKRNQNSVSEDEIEIAIIGNPNVLGESDKEVVNEIYRVFATVLQPNKLEGQESGSVLADLATNFSTSYQRIYDQLSSAIEKLQEERSKQIESLNVERQKLQSDAADERSRMMEEAKAELEKERAAIKAQREDLEEQARQLEISSHKDARRKQFSELQSLLTDAVDRPVRGIDLIFTRWAVFMALGAAGAGAFYFALQMLNLTPVEQGSTQWIYHALKFTVLTATGIGAFGAAAAWLRYFYIRDLNSRERMQRFKHDMARASWVMEASLEINREHGQEVQPEWLSGVTSGLFSSKDNTDTVDEGAQALAALIGLSASVKAGQDGLSVELNKKGRNVIKDTVDRN